MWTNILLILMCKTTTKVHFILLSYVKFCFSSTLVKLLELNRIFIFPNNNIQAQLRLAIRESSKNRVLWLVVTFIVKMNKSSLNFSKFFNLHLQRLADRVRFLQRQILREFDINLNFFYYCYYVLKNVTQIFFKIMCLDIDEH